MLSTGVKNYKRTTMFLYIVHRLQDEYKKSITRELAFYKITVVTMSF